MGDQVAVKSGPVCVIVDLRNDNIDELDVRKKTEQNAVIMRGDPYRVACYPRSNKSVMITWPKESLSVSSAGPDHTTYKSPLQRDGSEPFWLRLTGRKNGKATISIKGKEDGSQDSQTLYIVDPQVFIEDVSFPNNHVKLYIASELRTGSTLCLYFEQIAAGTETVTYSYTIAQNIAVNTTDGFQIIPLAVANFTNIPQNTELHRVRVQLTQGGNVHNASKVCHIRVLGERTITTYGPVDEAKIKGPMSNITVVTVTPNGRRVESRKTESHKTVWIDRIFNKDYGTGCGRSGSQLYLREWTFNNKVREVLRRVTELKGPGNRVVKAGDLAVSVNDPNVKLNDNVFVLGDMTMHHVTDTGNFPVDRLDMCKDPLPWPPANAFRTPTLCIVVYPN